MRVFLRDVHHYLYDSECSPRSGESYRIRRDIRARALEGLQAGAPAARPHMVVGHSLRSVIPYEQSPCRIGAGKPVALANSGSECSGLRSPHSR